MIIKISHAKVNAIREASKKLGTYNLENCVLYTSSEPCPMCLSAIIWANIKTVYYANSKEDTAKIGFRDDMIYDCFKGNKKLIDVKQISHEEAQLVYKEFSSTNDKMMY